jgi:hypothetical protein
MPQFYTKQNYFEAKKYYLHFLEECSFRHNRNVVHVLCLIKNKIDLIKNEHVYCITSLPTIKQIPVVEIILCGSKVLYGQSRA